MLFIQRVFRQHAPHLMMCAIATLGGCATTKPTVSKLTPLPQTEIEDSLQFGQETLYALMAAEIGLVRDRYELGLNNYVQQARDTQDVNITARAAQIARILKRHPESLEMAELWHQLDPGSQEARFILVSEYIFAERFQEAFDEADQLLAAGFSAGFDDIAIDAVQKNYAEIDTLYTLFLKRLEQSPNNVELLVGASVLVQAQENYKQALTYAEKAEAEAPDDVRTIYQRFRALSALERDDEATQAYARLVELQPDNLRMRNNYARMLVQFDLSAALKQYQVLHKQSPNDPDVLLNLALIQLELEHYEKAKVRFQTLIERQEHLPIAHFGLGEIANTHKDYTTALTHYAKVNSGRRFVQATSKAATIITSLSSLDEARAFLAAKRSLASSEDRESLFLVEANALLNSKHTDLAISTLNDAILSYPDSIQLRYARAMQFAILSEPLLAEQDFKHILKLDPNNAATLNALGYTLLDQTERLAEAGKFIAHALELEPNDAAILDSMGWYQYKLGNTTQALSYLKRAFSQFTDDEVAAHFGEVLWSAGKKAKAKQVWQKGFEDDPESPLIHNTLKRLNISWP